MDFGTNLCHPLLRLAAREKSLKLVQRRNQTLQGIMEISSKTHQIKFYLLFSTLDQERAVPKPLFFLTLQALEAFSISKNIHTVFACLIR